MQGTKASQYTSTLDCFVQIMKSEGPIGFYKGVVPRLGRVVPGQVSGNARPSLHATHASRTPCRPHDKHRTAFPLWGLPGHHFHVV
jgi:hypothetical protein